MELRHLRYFVAVAEELHFTRAARRLHMEQPPLSQQIRALEEELGVALLLRSKRHVALTGAGQRFLTDARRILREAQQAAEDARRAARGELGELRIGFSSSLPFTSLLPEVLRRYRHAHPDVTLTLREMFTIDQLEALQRDQIDIGLVRFRGSEPSSDLDLRQITRDPLRLVVNAGDPLAKRASVALAELKDYGFIVYPPGTGTSLTMLVRQLCLAAGFEPVVAQEAREPMAQIGFVAAGLGIAILPAPFECVHLDDVRYVALSDDGAHLSLGVAVRRAHQSPLIDGFLDQLKAE
ncbi:MAG TPA: LysR substrate-binding domain-containing protein [Dongiaceae bacterium]|nr:LysR substrate-binding domain-containing protein [Dongiaceae bacterium]